MAEDQSDRLLNLIGEALGAKGNPSTPILLYAELESNTADISIYQPENGVIVFKNDTESLFELLLDLWELAPTGRIWVAIEYLLHGSRFRATYRYRDDPDWSDDEDYRERVAERYFGDKPIVYPPLRPSQPGLTFKL